MPAPYRPADAGQPNEPTGRGYSLHRASGRKTSAYDVIRGRHDVAPRGRRRWLIPLVGLGVIGLVVLWLLVSLFQPLSGDGEGSVQVVIPRGAGVEQIAEVLEEKGVISSPFFFKARARVSGRSGDLKPAPSGCART